MKADRAAVFALVAASFFFYGWWNLKNVFLLIGLMFSTYFFARLIAKYKSQSLFKARLFLTLGLALNLSALGYFKYANFFVDNINTLFGLDIFMATIVLPLGISFFTFQKMAYLVDTYQGKVQHFNILDYTLFVMFFPQLIAGPIIHHSEVMPQFAAPDRVRPVAVMMGLTIFIMGLSKKVLVADVAARYSSPHFDAAFNGVNLDFITAWSAALAYTAQIYFDFSGYSDMAVGMGMLFGIRLPVNFNSPYKSLSIIDFWQRWHITLSRFLRDYLYIPLGGNRKGPARRYVNLMLVMTLGGIWHGAGWTFMAWGILHGLYLCLNHAWRSVAQKYSLESVRRVIVFKGLSWAMTFLAVVIAWVFFRALTFKSAMAILSGMAGMNGWGSFHATDFLFPALVLLAALTLPNVCQLTGYRPPEGIYGQQDMKKIPEYLRWNINWPWAIYTGFLLALCLMFMTQLSEFIYFQF